MKVMVTGGAGFIDSHLIKRLLKDGHEVVSLDNYSTGKEENHHEGCKYHTADIRDVIDFDFFMDEPDAIFNLAAISRIQPSLEFPALTFEVNVMGTMNLLEWMRGKKGCRFIQMSSSTVPSLQRNPYSATKEMSEDLCKMYENSYDMSIKVVRPYNVYGDGQIETGDYSTVIGVWIDQYKNNKPLTIVGDGEQTRDFTHIDDIVDGMIKVWFSKRYSPSMVGLGKGIPFSLNKVADMFGKDYPKEYIAERKGEQRNSKCDTDWTNKVIDWKPKKSLSKYIKRSISE